MSAHRGHGRLHSFPTRRSSDLDVVARVRRLFGTRRVGHAGTLDPAATGVPAWPTDRKSTRLNSSHRCISYAVLCLKKNNIDLRRDPWTTDSPLPGKSLATSESA